MPRLHTLYLPGNGEGMPFAFILDQATPMTEAATAAWQSFAENCGAEDIMITAETIDTENELSDGWEPDEPVGYTPADAPEARVIGLPDLMHLVRAAHAAAWEEWAPANLDPESPQVMTHRREVCPAFNDGITGCPMHDPILEGGWVTWPYFATPEGIITRICVHGVTHPTPEEYLSGFDTPHLCDGCPCAPTTDFSIVISDLANTQLPRGTLLLGVKDDPTPVTAPPAPPVPAAWLVGPQYHSAPATGLVPVRVPNLKACTGKVTLDERIPSANPCALGIGHRGTHLTLSGGALVGYLFAGNPIPVPDGEGPFAFVAEDLAPVITRERDATTAEILTGAPLTGGWARVQPLDADGEPVAEAKEFAATVTITEKEWVDPEENCFCGLPLGDCEHDGAASDMPVKAHVGPTAEELYDRPAQEACGAGTDGDRRCMYVKGHDGLHHFETGPFNRV